MGSHHCSKGNMKIEVDPSWTLSRSEDRGALLQIKNPLFRFYKMPLGRGNFITVYPPKNWEETFYIRLGYKAWRESWPEVEILWDLTNNQLVCVEDLGYFKMVQLPDSFP